MAMLNRVALVCVLSLAGAALAQSPGRISSVLDEADRLQNSDKARARGIASSTGFPSFDKLAQRADELLYEAKETGRNRVVA